MTLVMRLLRNEIHGEYLSKTFANYRIVAFDFVIQIFKTMHNDQAGKQNISESADENKL